MTTFADRIKAAYRTYKLGPALDAATTSWGIDPSAYSPSEYGDYIATSNNVYAVVTQRAEMLSSLKVKVYQQNARGERTELTQGDLIDLLHKVNPWWTFRRLIAMSEMTKCLWGVIYWFCERGERGTQPPQELWWGRPDRVSVVPHPTDYLTGFRYQAPNGAMLDYAPSEVIWMPSENPLDEFAGLSPLGAARLSADVASAAMKSNRNLFTNGLQMGGLVVPASGKSFTPEQAKELELMLDKRFRGVDKAHRWGVLRMEATMQSQSATPKDAEFMGTLNWSLEEICRAYHWPIDLVGGQRTYENVNAAHKAAWTHCLIPEANFIASEMTEKLLPMFGAGLECEFDASGIAVLHEDETAKWQRYYQQIQVGAITINEWRAEQGLEPVPWGDEPKGQAEPMLAMEPETEPQIEPERSHKRGADGWEYGGAQHRQAMGAFERQLGKAIKKLIEAVTGYFKQQQESLIAKNEAGNLDPDNPFDRKDWTKRAREKFKPAIKEIIGEGGQQAFEDLGVTIDFNIDDPRVRRLIETRTQRFAEKINETTWERLRKSIADGIESGDGIPELAKRIEDIMGDRIRSTPETIARTELVGDLNGASLEGWRQSGLVSGKTWLSALDDRTRTPDNGDEFDHVNAHGETVGIDEDFTNSGEPIAYPGADGGSAGNVINCRCTMKPELSEG